MTKPLHPAEQYARDVVRGKVVACRWVRKACQRHIDDLKHGHERGLYFDQEAAERALRLIRTLQHSKGEWANQPFEPEPWEQFYVWNIFGWKRAKHPRWVIEKNGQVEDTAGTRRFRTAYLEVGRKNGKSTLGATVMLVLAFADEVPSGEPGAECYTAATKRDQARIVHGEAVRMVRKSPMWRRNVKIFKDNLNRIDMAQKFEPLGMDADTADGLNVHAALLDEVHAHKSRDLWDVLETGTGARRQPMIIAITTAGNTRQGVCWEKHEYTCQVLDGIVDDDSWFGLIYTLDDGDDWRDESVWLKANPNLGVSKKWSDMRIKAERARTMTSALNAFMQKELNVWVQGETKWMNMDAWRACRGPLPALELPEFLVGRPCYSGLDLSSMSDITAALHVFTPLTDDEPYFVVCRFWIPEDNMLERCKDDRIHYDEWVREGYIEATPGNTIDIDYILEQFERDVEQFQVMEIPYDRWNAEYLRQLLEKRGITVPIFPFGQGYVSMSPPMKELEKLVAQRKIAHGDNPVLTWMADNLIARSDPAGNIKPDKEKSREKIDGIVALLMGLDRCLKNAGEGESVYGTRGIRTL